MSRLSLPDLASTLHRGEQSALTLASEALNALRDRADLGMCISLTEDSALETAEAADIRIADTRTRRSSTVDRPALPALLGVPLIHKDLTEVAGAITSHGSAAFTPSVATGDSPSVAVLRAAGSISLGKSQVPEFGLTAYSENRISSPARNPLDPSRTAGGSSGGSAAAVAAGIFPALPASDGGGSIRIPALACGLVGLKPGLGTIPTDLAQGSTDAFGAPTLTVTGPLARTALDAAYLGDVLRGVSRATSASHDHEPAEGDWVRAVRQADTLRGVRIGVSAASPFESAYEIRLSVDARRALDTAADALTQLGHGVDPLRIDYPEDYPEVFTSAWTSALAGLEVSSETEALLMPLTREFRRRARARTLDEHRMNARRIQDIAEHLRQQWGRVDVVLTPGLAFEAPEIGSFTSRSADDDYRLQCEWAPFTSMVNVAGLPAIAVPILRPDAHQSLPFGVQLIGRPGSEPQLLQLATQLEAQLHTTA